MARALKLVPPHWVRGTRRNPKLLLCEAPKLYVESAFMKGTDSTKSTISIFFRNKGIKDVLSNSLLKQFAGAFVARGQRSVIFALGVQSHPTHRPVWKYKCKGDYEIRMRLECTLRLVQKIERWKSIKFQMWPFSRRWSPVAFPLTSPEINATPATIIKITFILGKKCKKRTFDSFLI